jgi:glyoxylase I family protein
MTRPEDSGDGPPRCSAQANLAIWVGFPNDVPMNLEHLGLNYPDPVAAAAWYVANLGMKVARKAGPPGHGHFLADAQGRMMLEFYLNASVPIPDYRSFNPLAFHVAFHVDDVAAARERLLKAGATAEGEVTTNDDGDKLAMLRDPWGLPVQLAKRIKPMV